MFNLETFQKGKQKVQEEPQAEVAANQDAPRWLS